VIARDHVPGRVLGVATTQHVAKRHPVGLPLFAFDQILRIELPLFARLMDTLFEPAPLLGLADVQEEFHHMDAVLYEHALEIVNLAVTRLPDRLRYQTVDTRNQHVLVV